MRSRFLTAVIFAIFFMISLLTNIIGPLIPEIIKNFQLSLTMAAFLPFSFFVAYVVMSVPAGLAIEGWGEKAVILAAFGLALVGSLVFAVFPAYHTALASLFVIGLGMAALQVAINPLLRVTGGEEHYAFNSVVVQVVFGLASFLSPYLYSHFAQSQGGVFAPLVPAGMPWVAVYWAFSLLTFLILLIISLIRFPKVIRNQDERVEALSTHFELLRRPVVWAYFVGIFAYVGIEQGLSNWMSEFLSSQYGMNPQSDGATAVSRFWLFMTVGAALGLVLIKFFDSRKVLLGFSFLTYFTLSAALFGPAQVSYHAFALTGFTISVMWSIVFSLALNSLAEHHGAFSGILCTGIVGGALVPLLIGTIGDHAGLRVGLAFLFLPLTYIFAIGIWAKPLINNKTL